MTTQAWREGYEAALTGGPEPRAPTSVLGRPTPYHAEEHGQRVAGYEEGRRLLKSPAFRAGFADGLAGCSLPRADEWWEDRDWEAGNARARMGGIIAAP